MTNLDKKLWQRARFALFLLRGLPFVRLIAVNGSLAQNRANNQSDIDFFIIVKYGRLWLTRLLACSILDLFNLRAKNEQHSGKICLNHLLSNKNYLLDRRDSYNANQYSNLAVLYNINSSYEKFWQINRWIDDFQIVIEQSQTEVKNDQIALFKKILERLLSYKTGDFLEGKLKNLQLRRISNKAFFHQSDSVLKTTDEEFYYYTNVSKKYSAKY